MRNLYTLSVALLFLTALPSARAEPAKAVPAESGQAIAIIEDSEAKAFRFMIGGREVARLDASGLKVVGDITYGGTLTDTGSAWVEQQMQARGNKTPAGKPGHVE